MNQGPFGGERREFEIPKASGRIIAGIATVIVLLALVFSSVFTVGPRGDGRRAPLRRVRAGDRSGAPLPPAVRHRTRAEGARPTTAQGGVRIPNDPGRRAHAVQQRELQRRVAHAHRRPERGRRRVGRPVPDRRPVQVHLPRAQSRRHLPGSQRGRHASHRRGSYGQRGPHDRPARRSPTSSNRSCRLSPISTRWA